LAAGVVAPRAGDDIGLDREGEAVVAVGLDRAGRGLFRLRRVARGVGGPALGDAQHMYPGGVGMRRRIAGVGGRGAAQQLPRLRQAAGIQPAQPVERQQHEVVGREAGRRLAQRAGQLVLA
jgi:hypothetical protein